MSGVGGRITPTHRKPLNYHDRMVLPPKDQQFVCYRNAVFDLEHLLQCLLGIGGKLERTMISTF